MKALLYLILLLINNLSFADEVFYKWTGPSDEFCTSITSDGKTSQVDRKQCILKAPIQYLWMDKAHQKCGAYTLKNIFIASSDIYNCIASDVPAMNCAQTIETTNPDLRALIDGMLYKIIPEVLALKSGETVPEKIIKEKDSRLVAASIVARLAKVDNSKKDSVQSEEELYDFYHDSEIQMAFNDKNFESIRRGCFRNQFQTNSTNGADARSSRQSAEKKLADVTIGGNKDVLETPDDVSHHIRPKYAFFVPTKPMKSTTGHDYASNYGNVYAVMKDEVKDRSTFTAEDSLGTTERGRKIDNKADYKKIRNAKFGYWEAQVWGDVCFKDVSHFIVNCPNNNFFGNMNPELSEEKLSQMKETGIPIYQCAKEMKGVNTVYTKGKILSSEDFSKRKIDEGKANPRSNFPERRKDPQLAMAEGIKAREEYLKSPEYLKKMEELEKRKAFLRTPEGKAEMKLKREEIKKKSIALYEEYYKTPEGKKAKEAAEAIAKYYKTPEYLAAIKEGEKTMAAMKEASEKYYATKEGMKEKEDMDIMSYLAESGEHVGFSPFSGGSYPGMGIGSGIGGVYLGAPMTPIPSSTGVMEKSTSSSPFGF